MIDKESEATMLVPGNPDRTMAIKTLVALGAILAVVIALGCLA